MKKTTLSLILGLFVLFVLLFTTDSGSASDTALFLGRFHPLLVHLPIGILLMAVLLGGLSQWPRFAAHSKSVSVLLFVGAWSAILSAFAGLFLAQGGGYDEWTLTWHKRLGVAIAVLAFALYLLHHNASKLTRVQAQRGYLGLLGALLLTITFTGHLGGDLTHGNGYLTRYMPDGLRAIAGLPPKEDVGRLILSDPEEATTFDALIQPVLDSRCVACHNPNKTKGALLLDSMEGLLEGGDEGEVLVPGRPEESELIRRIWLPLSHKEHMPPEGRPQMTVAEAELIRWWIEQGASFEQTLAEAEMTPTIQGILDAYGLDEIRTGIFALDVPQADSSDILALQALGVSVSPLAEDEPFLQVRCTNTAACQGEALAQALQPLAAQVTWLDLGRTEVDDGTLAALANLQNLTRLHLELTPITDAGLEHLKGLSFLEYLNLYGTSVSDTGIVHLGELAELRALYLWQTKVSEAGVQRLKQTLPDLDVNLGLSLTPVTPVSEENTP